MPLYKENNQNAQQALKNAVEKGMKEVLILPEKSVRSVETFLFKLKAEPSL